MPTIAKRTWTAHNEVIRTPQGMRRAVVLEGISRAKPKLTIAKTWSESDDRSGGTYYRLSRSRRSWMPAAALGDSYVRACDRIWTEYCRSGIGIENAS